MKRRRKIVRVDWLDSCSVSDRWKPVEHAIKESSAPYGCVSVGIVLHETKEQIVLARGVDIQRYPNTIGTFVIPRGCIRKIKVLGRLVTEEESGD